MFSRSHSFLYLRHFAQYRLAASHKFPVAVDGFRDVDDIPSLLICCISWWYFRLGLTFEGWHYCAHLCFRDIFARRSLWWLSGVADCFIAAEWRCFTLDIYSPRHRGSNRILMRHFRHMKYMHFSRAVEMWASSFISRTYDIPCIGFFFRAYNTWHYWLYFCRAFAISRHWLVNYIFN